MKTEGEALFVKYAAGRRLSISYEPKLPQSPRRPDFLVESREGQVLCEVEDFCTTELDHERDRQIDANGIAMIGGDPWKRIRDTVEDGCKQLKPFSGHFPLVVVLYEGAGTFVPLETYMIQTALHGNEKIVIDGHSLAAKASKFSRDHAFLWKEHRAYLSAVAVLESFKPLESEVNDEMEEMSYRGATTDDLIAAQSTVIEKVLKRHPGLSLEYEVPRMRVVHNPFADRPLPIGVFTGQHDEQTAVDRSSGHYVFIYPVRTEEAF